MPKNEKRETRKSTGVRLSGVTITRVTGFNAKFIIENGIGTGAIVEIRRRGEVIPHIERVVKRAKTVSTPADVGFDWKWNASGVQAVIASKKVHSTTAVKKITYFFSKLKAEGIKQGTIQKLYDDGFDTILKIVRIKRDDLLNVEGIKEKSADKFLFNLNIALGRMTLPALMDASGLFGQGMGEKRISWVLKKYPSMLEKEPKDFAPKIVENVKGFSTTLAEQFVDGLPKFKRWYERLKIKAKAPKVVMAKGFAFKGKVVAWTGFRNAAQELIVTEQGGTVGSGVSSKTDILVVKDATFSSSKVVKARTLGITVLTNAQMQSKLDKIK